MKVALLLSGGVDSSVALHLLTRQGIRPDLYYIRIGGDEETLSDCPAEEDLEMVHWLAHRYGCPLRIVSLHDEYWTYVVEYMIRTVRQGLTPHPDLFCNRIIKFGYFDRYWGRAYDAIATGHYADKLIVDDRHFLATAADLTKDQTDFLARLTYEQLTRALFPLGKLTKQEVRTIAHREGLVTATRKDSQGICFLGKVDYNTFLTKHLGTRPGDIIDLESGRKVGEHRGYWFHTIGQRKGLGLSGGPWFVVRKDVQNNRLYVSNGHDPVEQYGDRIALSDLHYISADPFPTGCDRIPVTFKVRHTPDFTRGTLERTPQGATLHSDSLIQGIAPGQYCTLYDPEHTICHGSGLIVGGHRSTLHDTGDTAASR